MVPYRNFFATFGPLLNLLKYNVHAKRWDSLPLKLKHIRVNAAVIWVEKAAVPDC